MTKLEAARAEILEAAAQKLGFIIPSFVSEQYGRAVCSTLFRELDMAALGYEKRRSLYVRVAA